MDSLSNIFPDEAYFRGINRAFGAKLVENRELEIGGEFCGYCG